MNKLAIVIGAGDLAVGMAAISFGADHWQLALGVWNVVCGWLLIDRGIRS